MMRLTGRGRSAQRHTPWLMAALTMAGVCVASCEQNPARPGETPVEPGKSSFLWTVSPSVEILKVPPGAAARYTIRLDSKENINSDVSFGLSGSFPPDSTWTFAPQRLTSTARDAQLTIQTTSRTPFGFYELTITATELGYGTHDASIFIAVTETRGAPGLLLEVNPGTVTLTNGSQATIAFSVTPLNGFTGTVDINLYGSSVPQAPVTITSSPTPGRLIFASGDPPKGGTFVVGLPQTPSPFRTAMLTVGATSGTISDFHWLFIRVDAP